MITPFFSSFPLSPTMYYSLLAFKFMASFSWIVGHVYMYIDLCVELRLYGLSPAHMGMSVGVISVQHLFRQSCWWDFVGIASDSSRRYNLTGNSLILQPFTVFLPQRIYPLQYQNTVLPQVVLIIIYHYYYIYMRFIVTIVSEWKPGPGVLTDQMRLSMSLLPTFYLPGCKLWAVTAPTVHPLPWPAPIARPSRLQLHSLSCPWVTTPRHPLLFLWVLVWLAPLCSVSSHSQCRFLRAAFPVPGPPSQSPALAAATHRVLVVLSDISCLSCSGSFLLEGAG